MIPSHRAPDHVSCLQLGNTRRRVYCFWPVRSIKRISPEYWTPAGQRGQQYPHLALGPVPEHWLGVGYPGVRTTFSHMATPLVLYPGFLDKTNFPRILTPRVRYPQDPSTIPSLNITWFSRYVPLLGVPGTALLCPFITWGSIKRIFPEYQKTFLYLVAGVIKCV